MTCSFNINFNLILQLADSMCVLEYVRGQTISSALINRKRRKMNERSGAPASDATGSDSSGADEGNDGAALCSSPTAMEADRRGMFFVDSGYVCKSSIRLTVTDMLDSFHVTHVRSEELDHPGDGDRDRVKDRGGSRDGVSSVSSRSRSEPKRYQAKHLELSRHCASKSQDRDSRHGPGWVFEETVERDSYRYTAETYCRLYYISHENIVSECSSNGRGHSRGVIEMYRVLSLLAEQQQEHAKEHVANLLDVINFNSGA